MVKHALHKTAVLVAPTLNSFKVKVDLLEESLKFEGGIESFYKQIKQLIRPITTSRANKGTVMVYFSIDENGSMVLGKESRNKNTKEIEKEVLRVLNQLKGSWSKNYRDSEFTLPITFSMSGNEGKVYDHFEPRGYLLKGTTIKWYIKSY